MCTRYRAPVFHIMENPRGESLVSSLFYIDKSLASSLLGDLKQQTAIAYNSGSRRAADLESHTSHAEWHAGAHV
jgi:hypothetical protein